MIPKIIHFCWFGHSPFPPLLSKCMDSWRRLLPEYEVKMWNEDNFDLNIIPYVKEAYESKKYAFVSDYVRLFALYHFGGVYMDTDVEVLRPLDEFLIHRAFSGFEKKDCVPTGIIAAEREHRCIKFLMDDYNNRRFVLQNGTYDLTTNVTTITNLMLKNGLILNDKEQEVMEVYLYPQSYFCPNTIYQVFNLHPRKSYTIHHHGAGWSKDNTKNQGFSFRVRRYFVGKLRNFIGTTTTAKLGARLKS